MYCLKATLILLWVFFGCFSSPADAQVNIKTGYNLSYVTDPAMDELLSAYNAFKNYDNNLGKVHWLHGFVAGLRYKSGMHGVELTYQGGSSLLKGSYVVAGQEFVDRLRFAIHTAGIGYQVADRRFGAGTDLQYQFYKAKFTEGESGNVFRNVQEIFALKFYLMFTFPGQRGVDMCIQPYYVLPFQGYDLVPLANYLQQEPSSNKNRWNRIGISFLFYNGKKYDY